jgi:hypothetical protein
MFLPASTGRSKEKSMNATLRGAAVVCLALHFSFACAQTSSLIESSSAKTLSADDLKRMYLACDLSASTTGLPMSDVMRCSMVSEELKQRVFGNDFDRLLAWWRIHRRDPRERVSTADARETAPAP